MSPEIQKPRPEALVQSGKFFRYNPVEDKFITSRRSFIEEYPLSDMASISRMDVVPLSLSYESIMPDEKEMMVICAWCNIVEMPYLRKWLAELPVDERTKLCQSLESAMKSVYGKVDPQSVTIINKTEKRGKGSNRLFYFDARIYETGEFRLQTLGDCACLGVDNDSIAVHYEDPYADHSEISLPLGYCLHNADRMEQTLSLLAGAGILAFMAENDRVTI